MKIMNGVKKRKRDVSNYENGANSEYKRPLAASKLLIVVLQRLEEECEVGVERGTTKWVAVRAGTSLICSHVRSRLALGVERVGTGQ